MLLGRRAGCGRKRMDPDREAPDRSSISAAKLRALLRFLLYLRRCTLSLFLGFLSVSLSCTSVSCTYSRV